jgi:hypothetical protein
MDMTDALAPVPAADDDLSSAYVRARQDGAADRRIAEARARIAAEAQPEPPPPQAAQPEQPPASSRDFETSTEAPPPDFGPEPSGYAQRDRGAEPEGRRAHEPVLPRVAGAVAKDVGRGVTELPMQVTGGVVDAGREVLQSVADVNDWVQSKVGGAIGVDPKHATGNEIADTIIAAALNPARAGEQALQAVTPPEAQSTTGGVVRGLAEFLAGFYTGGKVIGTAKTAGRLARSANAALRGAGADAFAFDPKSENLANLLRKVPALREIVPAYLATDPNDTETENRLKNALVSLVPGILVDGALAAFRFYRARAKLADAQPSGSGSRGGGADSPRGARTGGETGAPPDANVRPGEPRTNDFALLGDPEAPLIQPRTGETAAAAVQAELRAGDAAAAYGEPRVQAERLAQPPPLPVQQASPARRSASPRLASESKAVTARGTEVPVRYEVVGANSLIASHTPDLAPNEIITSLPRFTASPYVFPAHGRAGRPSS